MRPIKFRFWDGKYFDAVTRIDWDDSAYPTYVETYHEVFDQVVDGDGKSRALEEYTGKNDCYGKPIYEGNIVELTETAPVPEEDEGRYDFHGVVEMLGSTWVVTDKQRRMSIMLDQDQLEPRVVGDVHQNPELLGDE